MLKAQNIKTNNQYIIAVKCKESPKLKTTIKKKKKILFNSILGLTVVHCPKGPKPKARDTMHK